MEQVLHFLRRYAILKKTSGGLPMGRKTDMQSKIYETIVRMIREQGYAPSVREIGDAVGLKSPSTVHFHLKGLRSTGLISQAEGKTRAISVNSAAAEKSRKDQIPLLGSVAAGSPILAEECNEDYITFDTDGLVGEHFALKVRGESMLNAGILPGDLVIVHQGQRVRNGDIVVALFEDEATVKTYHMEKNGHVWLLPENEAYEPIDGEGCAIVGRVVAVIRRY
jgi:repressor LexA